MVPEQLWDWHCCSYCFHVVFVSWSFVLCFAFLSLEFSVAGWRSVNLALAFLNSENGDFSILMRYICWLEFDIDLHASLGADETSGDVVICCQYPACCCWKSQNMHMTVAACQTGPLFCFWSCFLFGLFFGLASSFPCLPLRCCYSLYLGVVIHNEYDSLRLCERHL